MDGVAPRGNAASCRTAELESTKQKMSGGLGDHRSVALDRSAVFSGLLCRAFDGIVSDAVRIFRSECLEVRLSILVEGVRGVHVLVLPDD